MKIASKQGMVKTRCQGKEFEFFKENEPIEIPDEYVEFILRNPTFYKIEFDEGGGKKKNKR